MPTTLAQTNTVLPLVNACLNGFAALLLLIGFVLIRQGRREAHLRFMLAAFCVSSLFLANYLYYHFNYSSNRFGGEGAIRSFYFVILVSHIVLAVVILPFIIRLLWLSYKERFGNHARLGRYVWPVWMYTSLSGVLVYLMLYQWYPKPPDAAVSQPSIQEEASAR
jgi:uncharacterized membrane protein YozB (DUF420 family)